MPQVERVRVGVVGLGRLWEARHKPALLKLHDRFRVVAVYDQVARRADLEAASLRCRAARGLEELIAAPDLEAVYLLTPQWFGLHAAAMAARSGKAIYCALPPTGDIHGLEAIANAPQSPDRPFMPELARRFYPTTLRLRELLRTSLGRPRRIVGHVRLSGFDRYGTPGPSTQNAPLPLIVDPGGYLLEWCRDIFGDDPVRLSGVAATALPPTGDVDADPDFLSFDAEFPGGGLAEVALTRHHRGAWGEATRFLPTPGFEIYAERGAAWLEMPDRIAWSDSQGTHDERLASEPTVGEVMNDQFFRAVRGEPNEAPTLGDALAIARMDRELRASMRGGGGCP